jgi:mannose-6-phosphate isomerase
MNDFYTLHNSIKHYEWGSAEWIPRLTGQENPSGKPWAELWMGVHPQGMSTVTVEDKSVPLSNITTLPFMVKFLAVEKPLSIQAHPNASQARKGFAKENKAGIAMDAPERNYRDPRHKPEIICALEPFVTMAGFRGTAETEQLLSLLPGTNKLQSALEGGHKSFLSVLFNLDTAEQRALCDTVLAETEKSGQPEPLRLCGEFAKQYPMDPGLLSPLYLNVLKLEPFDAVFIPSGIPHAHIRGFALECMANSDNVLRGGLTPKHIDVNALFSILNFEPYKPVLLKPPITTCLYRYAISCKEFSLYLIKTAGADKIELEEEGDAIITAVKGTAECFLDDNTIRVEQGGSVFAKARKGGARLAFSGDGILFAAISQEAGHKQSHANSC